jgi:hypothetical protein
MIEPKEYQRHRPRKRIGAILIGNMLVLTLLFEITALLVYFGLMSLLILIGPGNVEPVKLLALGIHMIAAISYFVSFWVVGFCFFGVISRRSLVKRLLLILSIVGMLCLPFAFYETRDTGSLGHVLYFIGGLSVLLLINTLAAFHFMDSKVTLERKT